MSQNGGFRRSAGKHVEPERNDRFDPVEAFFAGISSGGVRLIVGLLAAGCGYAVARLAYSGEGTVFPFDLLFMIFAWASEGVWFVAGLAALLGGLVTIYRFGMDEGGKAAWYFIFLAFTFFVCR